MTLQVSAGPILRPMGPPLITYAKEPPRVPSQDPSHRPTLAAITRTLAGVGAVP